MLPLYSKRAWKVRVISSFCKEKIFPDKKDRSRRPDAPITKWHILKVRRTMPNRGCPYTKFPNKFQEYFSENQRYSRSHFFKVHWKRCDHFSSLYIVFEFVLWFYIRFLWSPSSTSFLSGTQLRFQLLPELHKRLLHQRLRLWAHSEVDSSCPHRVHHSRHCRGHCHSLLLLRQMPDTFWFWGKKRKSGVQLSTKLSQ